MAVICIADLQIDFLDSPISSLVLSKEGHSYSWIDVWVSLYNRELESKIESVPNARQSSESCLISQREGNGIYHQGTSRLKVIAQKLKKKKKKRGFFVLDRIEFVSARAEILWVRTERCPQ